MTRRQELLVFGLVAVVAVVAAFLLVIRPQLDATAQAQADERASQVESRSLADQIHALEALKANAPTLRSEARQARDQFPATPDLPDLVDALQDLADESGVELSALAPATPTASGVRPELAVIETSTTVSGSYFEIEDFLGRLEDLVKGADPDRVPPRSVLVRSVALTSASGGGGGTADSAGATVISPASSSRLQATIALSVFQLTGSDTAAAPAAGGTQVR